MRLAYIRGIGDGSEKALFVPWLAHGPVKLPPGGEYSFCQGGTTYFSPYRFSINEGYFPNIHFRWRDSKGWSFYLYVALTRRLTFWKNW